MSRWVKLQNSIFVRDTVCGKKHACFCPQVKKQIVTSEKELAKTLSEYSINERDFDGDEWIAEVQRVAKGRQLQNSGEYP